MGSTACFMALAKKWSTKISRDKNMAQAQYCDIGKQCLELQWLRATYGSVLKFCWSTDTSRYRNLQMQLTTTHHTAPKRQIQTPDFPIQIWFHLVGSVYPAFSSYTTGICSILLKAQRDAARRRLGYCPQFDAWNLEFKSRCRRCRRSRRCRRCGSRSF